MVDEGDNKSLSSGYMLMGMIIKELTSWRIIYSIESLIGYVDQAIEHGYDRWGLLNQFQN